MKSLLKLEELAMFILGSYMFSQLGAVSYNLFHHKGIAILIYFLGIYFEIELLNLAGIILFAHASLDRIFGYGLKFNDAFKNTHLGEIGK